jgi:transcriptional regulator with XRE-family HTH domain
MEKQIWFSNNLKELRATTGHTLVEISDETGINRETIRDYELDRTVPNIYNLVKLAKFFGVTLDQLVFG